MMQPPPPNGQPPQQAYPPNGYAPNGSPQPPYNYRQGDARAVASGVHPLVWVGLALGLLVAFGLAGAFAFVMYRRAGSAAAVATAAPLAPPSRRAATRPHAATAAPADDDDDDDDDGPASDDDDTDTDDDLQFGAQALPAPERDVPVHDVKLLDGCSSADLKAVESRIDDAIAIGAPAYNRGDFFGCYVAYDQAAKDIEAALPRACKGPSRALQDGRRRAVSRPQTTQQAWAMRDAFDGLLDVIDRKGPDL